MTGRTALNVDADAGYSKVVKAAGFIFIKSHAGSAGTPKHFPPTVAGQTVNTLRNLQTSLESAGGSLASVVRISVFLANIDRDFEDMDRTYRDYFADRATDELPVRTTIGVPLSKEHLLVQMDMIAVGDDRLAGAVADRTD